MQTVCRNIADCFALVPLLVLMHDVFSNCKDIIESYSISYKKSLKDKVEYSKILWGLFFKIFRAVFGMWNS